MRYSEDSNDPDYITKTQEELYMFVSYQVLGGNEQTVSISLFEYDMENNQIKPNNFVIITQKIN
jgi:hypothetical protein